MSNTVIAHPFAVQAPSRREARAFASDSPNAPRASGSPRLHLTRRGRVVVIGMTLLTLLGVFGLGRASSSSAAGVAPAPSVVLQPGDTLWTVAHRVAPKHDPREVVEQLREINHLPTSAVQAGQVLTLPR